MNRIIPTLVFAAFTIPTLDALAGGGAKAKVTYATDYQSEVGERKLGARKIFREVHPDPFPVKQYYYAPTLIVDHNTDGPNWELIPAQIDGTLLLQVRLRLFDDKHAALARDAILSRTGTDTDVKLTPLPLSTMVVSWQGPDPLPDGVRLKDDGVPSHAPSTKGETWIQFAIDPSVWEDDIDVSMLKRHLNLGKLRVDLVYDVMDDKTNSILVTLKTDAISRLKTTLDGISIPAKENGAPLVTREGERLFASEVRSAMTADISIEDPTTFDLDFVRQKLDDKLAEEVTLEWATFDEQRTKSSYHCDDIRPDVVFERFQNDVEVSEQVRERRRKLGVAGGGGFGPFSVSLAADSDKKDFDSFAGKRGLSGNWVGEQYVPKAVKVKQINLAKLDSLRSFSMVTKSVVRANIYEPITIELQSFHGPSEAQQMRIEAEEARERVRELHSAELRSIKQAHDSERTQMRVAHKTERDGLQARIQALKSPPTIRHMINKPVELMGQWGFYNPGKDKLTELQTERFDVEVQVRSSYEIVRVGASERIDVVVDYRAQRVDGRSGQLLSVRIDGTCRQSIYIAPTGKKIVQVLGGAFDTGPVRFGDSHRKRSRDGDGPGLYSYQAVPLDRAASWRELSVCFDEQFSKALELPCYGVAGRIEVEIVVER